MFAPKKDEKIFYFTNDEMSLIDTALKEAIENLPVDTSDLHYRFKRRSLDALSEDVSGYLLDVYTDEYNKNGNGDYDD